MEISEERRRLIQYVKDVISEYEDGDSDWDEMIECLTVAIDDLTMTP
jgi:hypothetical protein